jgi:hypothetical protein
MKYVDLLIVAVGATAGLANQHEIAAACFFVAGGISLSRAIKQRKVNHGR